jgi:hypothetical protein
MWWSYWVWSAVLVWFWLVFLTHQCCWASSCLIGLFLYCVAFSIQVLCLFFLVLLSDLAVLSRQVPNLVDWKTLPSLPPPVPGLWASLVHFFFFFGGTGVWTQDLVFAKQALYHLSLTSPFWSSYFGNGCLVNCLPQVVSKFQSSHLTLPSS